MRFSFDDHRRGAASGEPQRKINREVSQSPEARATIATDKPASDPEIAGTVDSGLVPDASGNSDGCTWSNSGQPNCTVESQRWLYSDVDASNNNDNLVWINDGPIGPVEPQTGGGGSGGSNQPGSQTQTPLYCNKDVIKASKNAWARSANGTARTEAGFLAFKDGQGNIGTANLPNTNQNARISFDPTKILPTGTTLLAVFHTHPTSGYSIGPSMGPAPSDQNAASELKVPVFVLNRFGLSSVDKNGNETKDVRKNLDWTKECK